MLDMIKQSTVPVNLMRTAAKGALALPAPEMVEILVFLSRHALVGEQARMTLAAWDMKQAEAIASDPATPVEVLEYFVDPKNLRPQLFMHLLENASVPEKNLVEIAEGASRDMAKVMLTSGRVRGSEKILLGLKANPHLTAAEHEAIKAAMGGVEAPAAEESPLDDFEETAEMREFLEKHAAEIEAEENRGFELFREEGIERDELDDLLGLARLDWKDEQATHKPLAKHANPEDGKKLSTLQKLARMTVGERVQAAMKGNKDERFILIRDGAKVVALAVLESPKLTDTEAEMIAGMKNVQEAVLRGVAAKRKFIKNYAVIRALLNNPRVPLDVTLPLMPHLLVMDLKHLSMNKNVSDLLRKLALKMFREKNESRKKE
jgi:arsenate reductase-like glutaredoxin family protein